jgi:hypothetical protein
MLGYDNSLHDSIVAVLYQLSYEVRKLDASRAERVYINPGCWLVQLSRALGTL